MSHSINLELIYHRGEGGSTPLDFILQRSVMVRRGHLILTGSVFGDKITLLMSILITLGSRTINRFVKCTLLRKLEVLSANLFYVKRGKMYVLKYVPLKLSESVHYLHPHIDLYID